MCKTVQGKISHACATISVSDVPINGQSWGENCSLQAPAFECAKNDDELNDAQNKLHTRLYFSKYLNKIH